MAGCPVDYSGGVRADGLPAVLSDPVRLASLASTGQVGTAPEPVFDDLARLASSVTGCGLAAITFVGEYRTYWKSVPSIPYGGSEAWQNPVGDDFCYFPIGLNGPFIVEDAVNDPRTAGHPAIGPWGVGAWAGFPIVTTDKQPVGSMCVIDPSPRKWTPGELETLTTLARAVSNEVNLRVALHATRAALATSEESLTRARGLARGLQESLLPPLLRPAPGVDAAARYLPATHGGESVTGDFYDLFPARGPYWTAVMGDVCGKGTEAAKVTALARYTLRADARDHLSPAEVLTRLNAAMLAQHAPLFLTAVQATFRLIPTGLAGRLCLAGHPPALIRRADGQVQQAGITGHLLGFTEAVNLADARFRLFPGDLLLLYTDGAIEARPAPGSGEPQPMFDDQALARTLAETRGMDAADTTEYIAKALASRHGGWASDDTALLALRIP
jgi:serine phosphatase RsbU (regulator of sigma subunit)